MAVSEHRLPPTDGQKDELENQLRAAIRKSGLDEKSMREVVSKAGEFQKGVISLLQDLGFPKNPFGIVKASWDYPEDFTMLDWNDQLEALLAIFPDFDAGEIEKQAKFWLEQTELWEQRFVFSKTGKEVSVYDGLAVSILPGRAAAKFGIGDLWEDVAKGRKGNGLWGLLCEEHLFPELAKIFSPLPFKNYRKGEMGSDRFLPLDLVVKWYRELEKSTKGDFIVRPFSFGRRLAGYSVEASRWEVENLFHGVPTPTWLNGQAILTNPHRFPSSGHHLVLDCGGAHYRFEDGSEFGNAPFFRRGGDEFYFDAFWVGGARDVYGAAFSAR